MEKGRSFMRSAWRVVTFVSCCEVRGAWLLLVLFLRVAAAAAAAAAARFMRLLCCDLRVVVYHIVLVYGGCL